MLVAISSELLHSPLSHEYMVATKQTGRAASSNLDLSTANYQICCIGTMRQCTAVLVECLGRSCLLEAEAAAPESHAEWCCSWD